MSSSVSSLRNGQDWVSELKGLRGGSAQQQAHADLGSYLYVVAYNYLDRRRRNLAVLSEFDNDELAELAHDFVQETLEKLAKNEYEVLSQYTGAGRFTSWVAQIITNQIASELRRPYWRRRGVMSDDLFLQQVDQDSPAPDRSALIAEVREVLERCLARLSDRYRIAFVRCIADDERADAVAQDLGITANAVYLLVYRAKRRLRSCVSKSGVGPDSLSIFPD
jgi:RNA polymerase sigma factor (sigma-70 family)